MPSTVNGIGTHYYGEKNVQRRPGICEYCRRDSVLRSYDTRLWFVVVFIPVIPLGKKHILNYCPLCTRHRVMSLAEWEKIKNQNLSEAMAGMAANPQDAKAAIKAHSALVAFGQVDEADKLLLLIKERFINDANTQAYLGSMLEYHGRFAEAIPFYQRALTLDPNLPEAKVAVALDLLQKNQLAEAHKLLRFLEAPGMAEYPGALFALADAYQRAGKHAEAMGLFQLLIERFPKLAQDKKFRQSVKKSESATGARSKLPARKVRWGPLLGWSSAIALVLLIALVSNYYISQHRTLYVVSGFEQPVTVKIPHHEELKISNRGPWTITLPEGKYQAALSGATNGVIEFSIGSTFWGRWFDEPAYILNAGGSALLFYENATYSANPTGAGGGYAFYFGKPFVSFPKVDYPFTPFPSSINLDSRAGSVEKTHIEMFHGDPKDAFMALEEKHRFNDALDLAEWYLRMHPEATEALLYYSYCADAAQQKPRAEAYFAEAVKRRPVELEWHRIYQELRINSRRDAQQVVAEYDAFLRADPTNSTLLYLCGRLETSKRKAIPLYEKAIAENPRNHYAHYALGMSFASFGDWNKALPEVGEAARLQPDNIQFDAALFQARMALKDFTALEKDVRAKQAKTPMNGQLMVRLGELLIAQGRTEEIEKLLADHQAKIEAKYPGEGESTVLDLKARLLYSSGKFAELEKLGSQKPRSRSKIPDRFDALLELGKLQDATDALKGRAGGRVDPFEWLALSAALKQAGDEGKSVAARTQAISALETDRLDCAVAAGWLKSGQPVLLEDVMDLSLPPERKKVLLVVLAQIFPAQSSGMLAAARQLNVDLSFPYHLINRLTDPQLVAGQAAK